MSAANERQIGGDHYRKIPGEQHWDRAVRLGFDFFQYMITKYTERAPLKNGKQDVEKALHFCQKWLESWDKLYGTPKKAALAPATLPLSDVEAAATGNAAALDWLMCNVIVTQDGLMQIGDEMYNCLRGMPSDYTNEGGYGDGRTMWTCTKCRSKVFTFGRQVPHAVHHREHCAPAESSGSATAEVSTMCTTCDGRCVPQACHRRDCPHVSGIIREKTGCSDRTCRVSLTEHNIAICPREQCPNKPPSGLTVTNDVIIRGSGGTGAAREITGTDRAVQGAEKPAAIAG